MVNRRVDNRVGEVLACVEDTAASAADLLRELRLRPPEGTRSWTQAWHAWLTGLSLNPTSTFLRDEFLSELDHLRRKIAEVEQLLLQQTQNDPIVKKLMTTEGIGFVTAVTMRAEIAHFDRFANGKKLSRYAGVGPRNTSSGQKQAYAGLVKAGNPNLRMVLIPGAWRRSSSPICSSITMTHSMKSNPVSNTPIRSQ